MALDRIKIVFPLTKDSEGYPPVDYESLWGQKIRGMIYRIDSIPFFSYEVALGDEVAVVGEKSGYRCHEVVKRSASSLLRVIYSAEADQANIRSDLASVGCDSEWLEQYRIISVNIPDAGKLLAARAILNPLEKQGLVEYEEAIVR